MGKITRQITPNRQPLTIVIVSALKTENNQLIIDKEKTTNPLTALIDTGANHSSISQKVINELNLQPISRIQLSTASEKNKISYLYQIVIGISLNEKPVMTLKGIELMTNWLPISVNASCSEGIEEQGFDVILGMDVIMQGHLSISDGILIFSI